MSMTLSVYVGPYAIVPLGFDWADFEHLVTNGRMEAGSGDTVMYLVPNVPLEPGGRQTEWEKFSDWPVQHVNPAMIVRECRLFRQLAEPVWQRCEELGIEILEGWGVVPCCS